MIKRFQNIVYIVALLAFSFTSLSEVVFEASGEDMDIKQLSSEDPSEFQKVLHEMRIKTFDDIDKIFEEKILESSDWFRSDQSFSDEYIKNAYHKRVNVLRRYYSPQGIQSISDKIKSTQRVAIEKSIFESIKKNINNYFIFLKNDQTQLLKMYFANHERDPEILAKGFDTKSKTEEVVELRFPKTPYSEVLNEKYLNSLIKSIDDHLSLFDDVQEISINIFRMNAYLAMALGEYIKEKNLSVYVFGLCTDACANYILPLAKSVRVGPYGFIGYQLSGAGLYDEYAKAFNYKDRKNLAQEEVEGRLTEIIQDSERYNQATLHLKSDDYFEEHSILQRTRKRHGEQSEIQSLASSFDETQQKDENSLSRGLLNLEKSEESPFSQFVSRWKEREQKFFQEHLPSSDEKKFFQFRDFIKLSSKMSLDAPVAVDFPDFVRSYDFAKKYFPYFFVPSVSLLKKMGISVTGGDTSPGRYASKLNRLSAFKMLYLDESKMEECRFFDPKEVKAIQSCLASPLSAVIVPAISKD